MEDDLGAGLRGMRVWLVSSFGFFLDSRMADGSGVGGRYRHRYDFLLDPPKPFSLVENAQTCTRRVLLGSTHITLHFGLSLCNPLKDMKLP